MHLTLIKSEMKSILSLNSLACFAWLNKCLSTKPSREQPYKVLAEVRLSYTLDLCIFYLLSRY